MKLKNVAKMFNKSPTYDAYTGDLVFKCQLVGDSRGSSAMAHSDRSMNVAPGTVIPTRRAIQISGLNYVVGQVAIDEYKGQAIRDNYHLEESKGLMYLLTPGEACLAATGTAFHANREFQHDLTNAGTDSEYDTFFNVLHAPSESVIPGSFFRDTSSRLYRARTDYTDQSGFQVAESDQFDTDARQAIHFSANGALDIVTGAIAGVSVDTYCVQTDLMKFYRFRTEAEGGQKPGDLVVFVAASAITPVVGALFTMNALNYRVVTVVAELDAWALRARLA